MSGWDVQVPGTGMAPIRAPGSANPMSRTFRSEGKPEDGPYSDPGLSTSRCSALASTACRVKRRGKYSPAAQLSVRFP
jgi:hypothetical protein